MSEADFRRLQKELRSRVKARAGSQVREFHIEVCPDGIRLSGTTTTFYGKQIVQQCAREILPNLQVVNDISVR
jgi:hypothetical protein